MTLSPYSNGVWWAGNLEPCCVPRSGNVSLHQEKIAEIIAIEEMKSKMACVPHFVDEDG